MARFAPRLESGRRMPDSARPESAASAFRARRGGTLLPLAALLAACVLFGARQRLFDAFIPPVGGPPAVVLEREATLEAGGGLYLSRISVSNTGDADLSRLRVEGVVTDESGRTERSEIRFDHVPTGSRLRGDLFFTIDPARHPPRLRVIDEAP